MTYEYLVQRIWAEFYEEYIDLFQLEFTGWPPSVILTGEGISQLRKSSEKSSAYHMYAKSDTFTFTLNSECWGWFFLFAGPCLTNTYVRGNQAQKGNFSNFV
jgi:hypothetical protein